MVVTQTTDMRGMGRFQSMRRLHFVGIGGVGMSGLAELMHNLGYQITGSDQMASQHTKRLESLGVIVQIGHSAEQVEQVDVVVTSGAVPADNPEVVAAFKARIPVIPRAELLATLMRFRRGIAVAGTHGKTTTTSLVAAVLAEGELDPTYVIGGLLHSSGSNTHLGRSDWLVVEADESDASFLHLQPMVVVVTNIDQDHLNFYEGSFERLKETFINLIHQLPFHGLAILCHDDPVLREMHDLLNRPFLTYGLEPGADMRATNIRHHTSQTEFDLLLPNGEVLPDISLNLQGQHNVLNALAALTVAYELDVLDRNLVDSLARFQGVARRLQRIGTLPIDGGDVLFIDDYAHHPRELQAAFDAMRASLPDRRLVVVFQPHRYTRTELLFDDFVQVLQTCDLLLVSEIYPADELAISGINGRALVRAVRQLGRMEPVYIEQLDTLADTLSHLIQAGDLVLTLGAGNIGKFAANLPEEVAACMKLVNQSINQAAVRAG